MQALWQSRIYLRKRAISKNAIKTIISLRCLSSSSQKDMKVVIDHVSFPRVSFLCPTVVHKKTHEYGCTLMTHGLKWEKIVSGGGTGFVGQRLKTTLKAKGYDVQIISRTKGVGKITWDEVSASGLPNCKAVVNLAGENILNPMRRWNEKYEEDVRKSRVDTTTLLAEKIAAAENPPEVFVSSSAVGYYPPSETAEYTEDTPPSDQDTLTCLCRDWEASAQLPGNCKTRLAIIRIGVVLGKEGGIVQQTMWPFWLGVGGVVGSGNQPFPWIHVQDLCDIIVYSIENDHVAGVLNGVAPEVSTNRDYTNRLASAFHRPAIIPMPAFVVIAVFGSVRGMIMLQGQKVIPKRTLELGYSFKFPDLKSAIENAIK